MDIVISKMFKEDLLQIRDTLSTHFDPFWSFEVFSSELDNPNSTYFVARQNTEIVGFVGIWKAVDDIHIMNIATRIDKRNLGVASKLLQHIIQFSASTPFTSLTLEVNEQNKPAIHLYEKYNFKKIGLRKNYYAQNENAIIMTLNLK